MVNQDKYQVEMYSRKNDQSLFSYQAYEGLDCIISLDDLDFIITLNEIYEDVDIEHVKE